MSYRRRHAPGFPGSTFVAATATPLGEIEAPNSVEVKGARISSPQGGPERSAPESTTAHARVRPGFLAQPRAVEYREAAPVGAPGKSWTLTPPARGTGVQDLVARGRRRLPYSERRVMVLPRSVEEASGDTAAALVDGGPRAAVYRDRRTADAQPVRVAGGAGRTRGDRADPDRPGRAGPVRGRARHAALGRHRARLARRRGRRRRVARPDHPGTGRPRRTGADRRWAGRDRRHRPGYRRPARRRYRRRGARHRGAGLAGGHGGRRRGAGRRPPRDVRPHRGRRPAAHTR